VREASEVVKNAVARAKGEGRRAKEGGSIETRLSPHDGFLGTEEIPGQVPFCHRYRA
jgi:hypothetical protein